MLLRLKLLLSPFKNSPSKTFIPTIVFLIAILDDFQDYISLRTSVLP